MAAAGLFTGKCMDTIVTGLARYASGLRFDQLPAEVVEKAKVCILDVLGVAAGGFQSENAQVALRTARHFSSAGKATVWMTGERMRAIDAVLPNSVAAHCILQDDWLQVSHSHIGAAVVPTALAIAEETGSSGKDVIAAVVAGYDIEDRAGSLSVPAFTRGFRASSVYSYFGATAVAARMLGLDEKPFADALGCAGSMCGGVLQPWNDGSMEWSFQEAFGSRAGITAAALARDGLVGSRTIFEGSHGVNRSFSGTNEGERAALDRLGSHFHIVDTCFKRFPTGGANQGSAAVAYALKKKHAIDHRRIRRIDLAVPKTGTHERMNYAGIGYAGPFYTVDQCLISKIFAVAIILKTGDMTIDLVRREQQNTEVLTLCRKTQLREAEGMTGWQLHMEIELDDGAIVTGSGDDIDQRHLYLSWPLAVEKFQRIAGSALGDARCSAVVELVGSLDKLDAVSRLVERFTGAA
ncbi:MAG: MmgE/PrpD family protein [Betaproteobacteria bacterium]|nr:MmgE/PrpD family protein [Betaproteobacteria bacterium]